jgi:hypothetical protein
VEQKKNIDEMKLEGEFKINPTKSSVIFDKYPMSTISISLLEEVGGDHKERENFWIDYFGDKAVNKKKAFTTDVHLGIEDPKERFKMWQKAYKKEYYDKLPHVQEKIKAGIRRRQQRYKSTHYQCPCGVVVCHRWLTGHQKSQHHKNFLEGGGVMPEKLEPITTDNDGKVNTEPDTVG